MDILSSKTMLTNEGSMIVLLDPDSVMIDWMEYFPGMHTGKYYSNGGSIYGVASDRFKNLSFKARKQSQQYANLFFTGGSVNPGGGMPMVFLCGQQVAKRIVAQDQKAR